MFYTNKNTWAILLVNMEVVKAFVAMKSYENVEFFFLQ